MTLSSQVVNEVEHSGLQVYFSDSQLASRFHVSRQTIWRWVANDPEFPTPIKLSPGCTRWKLSAIEAWESSKGGAQ
jgi:prophage regulatory protein